MWVSTNIHPVFSTREYVIGVGAAPHTRSEENDLAQADSNARTEIAKQVQIRVEEVMSTRQHEAARGEVRTGSYEVSVRSQESVGLTLEGVKIVERSFDKKAGQHYALAVLPRVSTSIRLADQAAQGFRQAKAALRESALLIDSGDVVGAARRLILASDVYEKAVGHELVSSVLGQTGSSPDRGPPPFPTLMDLVDKTKLEVGAGDGQAGVAGSPLPRPIRVRAVYAGAVPVARLPLAVEAPSDAASIEPGIRTNANGEAEIRVLNVRKTGRSVNSVPVRVAWDDLVQESLGGRPPSWMGRLGGGTVAFRYRLRTKSETRVLVQTCVSREDRVVSDTVLLPRLMGEFKKAGFQVLEAPASLGAWGACPKPDDLSALRESFRDRTDLLVLAVAATSFAGVREAVTVHRAHLFAAAYDLTRDETVASLEGEAAGGGNTPERAADRSVRQVAEDLAPELVRKAVEGLR
ncbi:MAG: LPP20 family lipoprotein [Nitrospirae bacterium]|nr:LPP20 family lipoprotein [Nitrospirota bacterium]